MTIIFLLCYFALVNSVDTKVIDGSKFSCGTGLFLNAEQCKEYADGKGYSYTDKKDRNLPYGCISKLQNGNYKVWFNSNGSDTMLSTAWQYICIDPGCSDISPPMVARCLECSEGKDVCTKYQCGGNWLDVDENAANGCEEECYNGGQAIQCPSTSLQLIEEDCHRYAYQNMRLYRGSKTMKNQPKGCIENGKGNGKGAIFFNTHETGKEANNWTVICHRTTYPTMSPTDSSTPNPTQSPNPDTCFNITESECSSKSYCKYIDGYGCAPTDFTRPPTPNPTRSPTPNPDTCFSFSESGCSSKSYCKYIDGYGCTPTDFTRPPTPSPTRAPTPNPDTCFDFSESGCSSKSYCKYIDGYGCAPTDFTRPPTPNPTSLPTVNPDACFDFSESGCLSKSYCKYIDGYGCTPTDFTRPPTPNPTRAPTPNPNTCFDFSESGCSSKSYCKYIDGYGCVPTDFTRPPTPNPTRSPTPNPDSCFNISLSGCSSKSYCKYIDGYGCVPFDFTPSPTPSPTLAPTICVDGQICKLIIGGTSTFTCDSVTAGGEVKELCPKFCDNCGHGPDSPTPSPTPNTTIACVDGEVCTFIIGGTSTFTCDSITAGGNVKDLCPRTCDNCGHGPQSPTPSPTPNTTTACVDGEVCTFFIGGTSTFTCDSVTAGGEVKELCPRACNNCGQGSSPTSSSHSHYHHHHHHK